MTNRRGVNAVDVESIIVQWVSRIAAAVDERSPLAGVADLSAMARLPAPVQKAILDRLTPDQAAAYRRLYGSRQGN